MNTTLLTALAFVSALSTLTTEGIKKILIENKIEYRPNLLAGLVAVILSCGSVLAYMLYYGQPFTVQMGVVLVTFSFLSWLVSMTSYDKVKQLLEQFKGSDKS